MNYVIQQANGIARLNPTRTSRTLSYKYKYYYTTSITVVGLCSAFVTFDVMFFLEKVKTQSKIVS